MARLFRRLGRRSRQGVQHLQVAHLSLLPGQGRHPLRGHGRASRRADRGRRNGLRGPQRDRPPAGADGGRASAVPPAAVTAEPRDARPEAAETACATGSAIDRLRALTVAFMRLYASAQNPHKVLLNELDNLPPERRADVVAKQRRIIEAAESVIVEIAPRGGGRGNTMLLFRMINWTH